MIQSERLWIGSMVRRTGDATEMAEEFAAKAGVSGAAFLRMRLLVEETMGMVQALLPHFEGEIWLEGDDRGYRIILEADVREEEEYASLPAQAPVGFMAKIAGMLNCSYVFEDASEVPDRLYSALPEFIRRGMGEGSSPVWAGKWSLSAYRQSLEARRKEAAGASVELDELEKSIVAQIADDVTVGISGGKVRMAIIRNLV